MWLKHDIGLATPGIGYHLLSFAGLIIFLVLQKNNKKFLKNHVIAIQLSKN